MPHLQLFRLAQACCLARTFSCLLRPAAGGVKKESGTSAGVLQGGSIGVAVHPPGRAVGSQLCLSYMAEHAQQSPAFHAAIA
jgi:hypothetical protein